MNKTVEEILTEEIKYLRELLNRKEKALAVLTEGITATPANDNSKEREEPSDWFMEYKMWMQKELVRLEYLQETNKGEYSEAIKLLKTTLEKYIKREQKDINQQRGGGATL